jgi:hypothetical protein
VETASAEAGVGAALSVAASLLAIASCALTEKAQTVSSNRLAVKIFRGIRILSLVSFNPYLKTMPGATYSRYRLM